MSKRHRPSSLPDSKQLYIDRDDNLDPYNSNSLEKPKTKKHGISSCFRYIKERETNIKTKAPYIDTIRFPFDTSGNFKLERYFITGKDSLLFNTQPPKSIYEIFIYDNKLLFREYIDISTNSDNYHGQHQKECGGLFENQDENVISHDIEGFIIDSRGIKVFPSKSMLCDDIDLDNFLFKDGNNNLYYINYDIYKDVFNLFYSTYNNKLILELYNGQQLRSADDIETFKLRYEDEYLAQLQNEKLRLSGGTFIKKYKKILKTYK